MLNLLKYIVIPLLVLSLSITTQIACTGYGQSLDSGVDAEEYTNGDPGDEKYVPQDDGECEHTVEPDEYCPESMSNTQPPVVVEYYGESGILPKDAFEPTWDEFVAATWEGVRRLEQPYQLDCLEDFVTDPPGLPCSADTVLNLKLQDNSSLSFLLGVNAKDIEAIPAGTSVEYSTPFGGWDVDSWGLGINLVVRRASDEKLLLAAMGWDKIDPNDRQNFGPVSVELDKDYVCGYRTYMDCKHYAVSAISIISGSNVYRAEPGESIMVPTSDGDYIVTHRRGKVRTCFECTCCADFEANRFSYSILLVQ